MALIPVFIRPEILRSDGQDNQKMRSSKMALELLPLERL
jgi:hypothetical protein